MGQVGMDSDQRGPNKTLLTPLIRNNIIRFQLQRLHRDHFLAIQNTVRARLLIQLEIVLRLPN